MRGYFEFRYEMQIVFQGWLPIAVVSGYLKHRYFIGQSQNTLTYLRKNI